MTLLELFRCGEEKEIVENLCILLAKEDCENCTANKYCKVGHTGFKDLLNMDIDDIYREIWGE